MASRRPPLAGCATIWCPARDCAKGVSTDSNNTNGRNHTNSYIHIYLDIEVKNSTIVVIATKTRIQESGQNPKILVVLIMTLLKWNCCLPPHRLARPASQATGARVDKGRARSSRARGPGRSATVARSDACPRCRSGRSLAS